MSGTDVGVALIARLGRADRSRLLDDLQAGRVRARPTTTRLRDVVHGVVERSAGEASSHLFTSRCPADSVAHVDVRLLAVALWELVDNAVAHGPPGTHAHLDITTTDEGVEIAVADDGPGIPDSTLRLVGVVPDGRSLGQRSPHMAGIGLALTQLVLRAHGRQLDIESTPSGTLVRLLLPPLAETSGPRGGS